MTDNTSSARKNNKNKGNEEESSNYTEFSSEYSYYSDSGSESCDDSYSDSDWMRRARRQCESIANELDCRVIKQDKYENKKKLTREQIDAMRARTVGRFGPKGRPPPRT